MENCVPLEPKSLLTMRFVGTIDAKLDQKGRVFLPAQFRRLLCSEGCEKLIMRGDIFEKCLVIYPESIWNQRMDELRVRLSVWNRKQQQLFRQFVTDVEWISTDQSGRFLIPKRYLQMAGIQSDVTFIGMDNTIEIWAKDKVEKWNVADNGFGESLEQLME